MDSISWSKYYTTPILVGGSYNHHVSHKLYKHNPSRLRFNADLMAKKARHDDIIIAGEHSGNVTSFFTLPQLNVIRTQVDRMTPQLIEPGLKRHSCAHRRLGKNHGHRHSLQWLVVLVS